MLMSRETSKLLRKVGSVLAPARGNRAIEVECVRDNLPLAVLLFPPHGGVLAVSGDRVTFGIINFKLEASNGVAQIPGLGHIGEICTPAQ